MRENRCCFYHIILFLVIKDLIHHFLFDEESDFLLKSEHVLATLGKETEKMSFS